MKKFKVGDVITLRAMVTDEKLQSLGIRFRIYVERLTVEEEDHDCKKADILGVNADGFSYWVNSEWYDKSND